MCDDGRKILLIAMLLYYAASHKKHTDTVNSSHENLSKVRSTAELQTTYKQYFSVKL